MSLLHHWPLKRDRVWASHASPVTMPTVGLRLPSSNPVAPRPVTGRPLRARAAAAAGPFRFRKERIFRPNTPNGRKLGIFWMSLGHHWPVIRDWVWAAAAEGWTPDRCHWQRPTWQGLQTMRKISRIRPVPLTEAGCKTDLRSLLPKDFFKNTRNQIKF